MSRPCMNLEKVQKVTNLFSAFLQVRTWSGGDYPFITELFPTAPPPPPPTRNNKSMPDRSFNV